VNGAEKQVPFLHYSFIDYTFPSIEENMTKKIDNIAEYSRPNRLPRLMGPGRREIRSARAPSVSLALALRRAATTRRLLDLAVEIDPTVTLFQDPLAAAGSACFQILSGARI